LTFKAFWDSVRTPGKLRVLVSVDSGPDRRARRLVTEDFILAPDGSFVGEGDRQAVRHTRLRAVWDFDMRPLYWLRDSFLRLIRRR
jgi:hypothetical protein